jgi:hypothetical protein
LNKSGIELILNKLEDTSVKLSIIPDNPEQVLLHPEKVQRHIIAFEGNFLPGGIQTKLLLPQMKLSGDLLLEGDEAFLDKNL